MLDRYYEHSAIHALFQRWRGAFRPLRRSYRFSRFKRGADRVANATRESWLVRWLTSESEPDVIVVDLRETWTVGPVIALLDGLLRRLDPAWAGSSAHGVLCRTLTAVRNAPVQLASAVFLGVLVGQFVFAWASASDTLLAVVAFLAAPAIVGLRVDWTWDELADSRPGRLAAALLLPPEPPDEAD